MAWNAHILTPARCDANQARFLNYDIVLILEAGKKTPPDLPDYVLFGSPAGAVRPTARRGAGAGEGVYAYVRRATAARCRLVRETQFALWLCVQGACSSGDDLYLAAIYLPPHTSNKWGAGGDRRRAHEHAFAALRDQILTYKRLGRVALFGDFNARVGGLADAPTGIDDVHDALGLGRATLPAATLVNCPRAPLGPSTDDFGRNVIAECCLATGCVLLNGRAPGDERGATTCRTQRRASHERKQKRRKRPNNTQNSQEDSGEEEENNTQEYESVTRPQDRIDTNTCIDFGIADAALFKDVAEFKVIEMATSFAEATGLSTASDHSALHCTLWTSATAPTARARLPGACSL